MPDKAGPARHQEGERNVWMREQPHREVDIDKVRAYALDLAESTSLRYVARLIPVCVSTLHNFLGGAAPHPRVRTLLCKWYLRETGKGAEEAAAVDVLCEPFTGDERQQVRAGLLGVVARAHAQAGRKVPEWIRRVRGDG
jgi:hypothetical protein